MCGIIGIASPTPVSACGWFASGRDVMRHRGPDDVGEWWSTDGCVGMGHRRLAIIDLSPAGHQPMQCSVGELCVVFNGEIYNFVELRRELVAKGHAFHSQSDTEVILAAYREWGADCLSRLNGMFAFAIYDGRRRQLFMARDRAGEKPLYYALVHGSIRFASELKGLMADPSLSRRINPEGLDCYLSMGFVPGDRCILQGVKKLPPAHALTFSLESGKIRWWRYWRLPEWNAAPGNGQPGDDALLHELETLLEDAVRRQLVADVPVGVLLSGGVDSSLITAMAVRAKPKVTTFTVRFPGHGNYDESKHARLIADHFDTNHVELVAEESSADHLLLMARQFDEPIVDSSMIPAYLVSRLVRERCTVALGGDGGDELFGGYTHYNRWLSIQHTMGRIPRYLRLPIAKAAEALLPVGFKGRNWLKDLGVDYEEGLPPNGSYFDGTIRRRLIAGREACELVAARVREHRIPKTSDLLQRATRMDFENYLSEDILVKVDRASMLNSLEIRSPFLDYRLIEFAFGKVPSNLKATAASRKVLLKKLALGLLPGNFDFGRKQGFSVPLDSWLQSGPWRTFFREVLLDAGESFFDRATVEKLLDGQARGRSNSERLFALVLIELWRKEYGVNL